MKNKIEFIENVYLTPMDIEKRKDFDTVLHNYKEKKAGARNWRNSVIWISLALVSFSLTGVLVFNKVSQTLQNESNESGMVDYPNEDSIDHHSEENSVVGHELTYDSALADSGISDTSPVNSAPVKETEVPENVQPQKAEDEFVKSEPPLIAVPEPIDVNIEEKPEEIPLPGNQANETSKKAPLSAPQEAENSLTESNITFEDAHPLDGFENLYAWFATNITYPEEHRKEAIEGSVKVSFLVDKDSTISEIKVTQSLGVAFDQEAVRLIERMPKWVPATRDGIPISRTLVFPISFKIESR